MAHQIITKDPADLSLHAALKRMPEWADDDPRFLALVDDIRARGIDEALKIDAHDQIIDGRHRWRSAIRLQLTEVPCRCYPDAEVASIILHSLVQRRHYSKGALAYLAYPLLAPTVAEAKTRRLENLKKGGQFGQNPQKPQCFPESTLSVLSGGKDLEHLAESLGLSRVLLFQAKGLHEAFQKEEKAMQANPDLKGIPTLRERFEPQILEGEIGLGACLAGLAGGEATRDKSRTAPRQLELFTTAVKDLRNRYKYWSGFGDAEKDAAQAEIRRAVVQMPPELRKIWFKAIVAAKKEGS